MINGTKDWAEAAAHGHSPMEAADSAWVRFDAAAVALSLMDDGLTDDEVRTKLRNLIDGGCICVGDLPDLTKLREQWDGEGRRARAHAKTVERLPQTNAPTDGAALLDQVHAFIGRFVAYPSKEAQDAHTLWIAHTHAMDAWESTPRAAFPRTWLRQDAGAGGDGTAGAASGGGG